MAKRALCIGINDYPGTGSDLAGCVNDARDWAEELTRRGFEVSQMIDSEATKAAMEEGIRTLVSSAADGDSIMITYSGHGTWMPDQDGDEPDRRDEALCPYDLTSAGPLVDDRMYEIFSDRKQGARVVLISDSCHSGSLARVSKPLGEQTSRIRYLPPEVFISRALRPAAERAASAPFRGASRTSALVMAGCQDTEYSYDANFGGRPNGAFTYVALRALKDLKDGSSYADWMKAIREKLPSQDYPQTPRLDATSAQRRWELLT